MNQLGYCKTLYHKKMFDWKMGDNRGPKSPFPISAHYTHELPILLIFYFSLIRFVLMLLFTSILSSILHQILNGSVGYGLSPNLASNIKQV